MKSFTVFFAVPMCVHKKFQLNFACFHFFEVGRAIKTKANKFLILCMYSPSCIRLVGASSCHFDLSSDSIVLSA